jgi:glycosyltransferase involved in cell wall biosynthesis
MKGMHIPLAALERRRDLRITLDIYGGVQTEDKYVDGLRRCVARDSRVRLLPAVPPDTIVEVLAQYDVVLVPSQVMETGPLVVLEAFAAGVPVIGSALGGIAEWVRDDIDGRLLDVGSMRAWENALDEIVNDPLVLAKWRAAIVPPPSMGTVADEMNAIYKRVTGRIARSVSTS